jgi:hypothetical protein
MTDSLFHVINVIAWVIVVYLQISMMYKCVTLLDITYKTAHIVVQMLNSLKPDNKDGTR